MESIISQNYDAIIVGSGPGGATVTRELSMRGQKTLTLERGPSDPVKGSVLQAIQIDMIPGKSFLLTPQLLGIVRTLTLEGSSIMAYACAFDPPECEDK